MPIMFLGDNRPTIYRMTHEKNMSQSVKKTVEIRVTVLSCDLTVEFKYTKEFTLIQYTKPNIQKCRHGGLSNQLSLFSESKTEHSLLFILDCKSTRGTTLKF